MPRRSAGRQGRKLNLLVAEGQGSLPKQASSIDDVTKHWLLFSTLRDGYSEKEGGW